MSGKKLSTDGRKELIEMVSKTQGKALDRAPSQHAGIIQIALFVAAICIILGSLLIHKSHVGFGSSIIVVAIIVLALAMYFIRPRSPNDDKSSSHDASDKMSTMWSRVTINLPIPQERLNLISEKLLTIRTLAQSRYTAILQARDPSIVADNNKIRTNIFLPDTRDAVYGEVCGLYIPKGLHHGMTDENERWIRFRPNEGLTGRVYTTERACGARRDSAITDWKLIQLDGVGQEGDEAFELTQKQVSLVTNRLRWIVSFPLQIKMTDATNTVGILNIDGLDQSLSAHEMQEIYSALRDHVAKLSAELTALEKRRLTIVIENA